MKKTISYILVIAIGISLSQKSSSNTIYRTQIFNNQIKTLMINVDENEFALPIIELNSSDKIIIRFDEMSHDTHNYNYSVIHCNADWTSSDITTNEYINGYVDGYITNYERSVNTHHLYTNYNLRLPNNDMQFKISGNYAVLIYEDNQKENPIAQACFSIIEPKVSINANIRYNTDIEINGRFQQLDFDILMNGYYVRDLQTEIKTTIRQNNRIDNEVKNPQPTYISDHKLSFTNNKSLIFEGGNEYHNFDISSLKVVDRGVDRIKFDGKEHIALLTEDKIQRGNYMHDYDVNGRFIINSQDAFYDVHTEADYVRVHFHLPTKNPFFDGQLYLGGEFNYNQLNSINRINYNIFDQAYSHNILLKQGGYNYQYWFVPKNRSAASIQPVDGSYWQTQNEYTIYVYHRAWGERYDKLIGVETVENL